MNWLIDWCQLIDDVDRYSEPISEGSAAKMIAIEISTIIIIGLVALIVGMMIGISLARPTIRK